MGVLRTDLKRIFTSWVFYLSVAIVVIGGIIQCLLIYPDPADHSSTYGALNCFLAAFCLSGYGPVVAPVLAVLPFATAYIDDIQTGYVKYIAARTTRKIYIIERVISTGISGGMVLLLGYLLTLAIFTAIDPQPSARTMILGGAFVNIYHRSMLQYALLTSINAFASGSIYALLCMAFSAVANNKYIGIIAPTGISLCSSLIAWAMPFASVKNALLSILPSVTLIFELTTESRLIRDYILIFTCAAIMIVISYRWQKNGRL